MKKNSLLPVFLLSCSLIFCKPRAFTIEQALKNKFAEFKVVQVNGYTGQCLKLSVINLSSDSVYIKITPGWVFDSDDNKKQDLLVVKAFIFALKKGEQKTESIYANCCQMKKSAPTGSKFSKSKLGKSQLVELAEFVSSGDYPVNVVTNAVWAVSDNAPISNICGAGEFMDEEVRKKVAQILKKSLPWYHVTTKTKEFPDGRIEVRQISLYGEFSCNLRKGTEFQVKLTDVSGREIMLLSSFKTAEENFQNYFIDFSVEFLPKNEFYIMFEDRQGKELLKKNVDLKM